MTAERDIVEVEQIDREMAAEYGLHRLYSYLGADRIREGLGDDDELVQAFACHRINCLAASERTKDHG